jgi:hypothetical protein
MRSLARRSFVVAFVSCLALGWDAHAGPADRRCAAFTSAPHLLQAAGRATAADEAQALAAARQQATAEVARSLCATIRTVDRDLIAERDGQTRVEASSSVEVDAQVEGLEGLEVKETAAWKNRDGSVEACVIVEVSRLALEERRRRDVEVLSRVEAELDAASARCGPAARAALDALPARLRGLCAGLRTAKGSSPPALVARVAQARAQMEAAERTAAGRRALGLACARASGGAIPCPARLVEAAGAALAARGVTVDAAPLPDATARALLSGASTDELCGRGALVLRMEVVGEGQEKRKKATEHFARVRARWVRLTPRPGSAPERLEGPSAEGNAGALSADDAVVAAAEPTIASLEVP